MDLNDEGWQIECHGTAKSPPEIDIHNKYWGSSVIYYDVDSIGIKNTSGQSIDLTSITPPNWSWKQIKSTSENYCPPENLTDLQGLVYADPDDNELVIGDLGAGVISGEQVVTRILWIFLVAKFCSENGYPATKEAGKTVTEVVLTRRSEIMQLLKTSSLENTLNKPFA